MPQHIAKHKLATQCLQTGDGQKSSIAAVQAARAKSLQPELRRYLTPHAAVLRQLPDSGLVMVDLAFWDDFFKQRRSWDDFGTIISGI